MCSAFTSVQHIMRSTRCSPGQCQAPVARPPGISFAEPPLGLQTHSAVVPAADLRRGFAASKICCDPCRPECPWSTAGSGPSTAAHATAPRAAHFRLLNCLAPQQDLKACITLVMPSAGAQPGVAAPAAIPVAAAPAEQPAAATTGQVVGISPAATAPSAFGGTPATTPKVRNVLLIR